MQEMTMQEIKEVSLALLEKLDKICRANGITYYLAYGTLLGAVRHKGFIPWDDDVDIWVPYEQFELLMDRLSDESGYQVLNYQDGSFWFTFSKFSDARTIVIDRDSQGKAKRRGVSVDIFPLYGCISKDVEKYRVYSKLRQIMWLFENGYSLKWSERAIGDVLKFIGKNELFWRKQLCKLQEKREDAANVGNPLTRYRERDIHPRECFGTVELDFEGRHFIAPKGYDRVLRDIYGDYMQLPPEASRTKTHSSTQAFWLREDCCVNR